MSVDADTGASILLEEAVVASHQAYPGEQHILRLQAPRIASRAAPGSFAHVRCDERLAMRRPLSIMRASAEQGWIEFLYKVTGDGTALLARQPEGASLSVLGPIGRGFRLPTGRRHVLLVGGGVGIPPVLFMAEMLVDRTDLQPLVLMGSELPFPFATRPSTIMLEGMPPGVIAGLTLLDDWGVPSRLASRRDYPGCHDGYVTDLARSWLVALDEEVRKNQVVMMACGPTAMLRAAAALAEEFAIPAQVCLEEFMACAVGGCAGCAVRVRSERGDAMKRVCVDGPVFDASAVVWEAAVH